MDTAPPHYQHVLENLAKYPIYDPATHKQLHASNPQPAFSRTAAPASAACHSGFSRNAAPAPAPAPSAVGHSSSSQGSPTSAAHHSGFSRNAQPADLQPALSRNVSASAGVSTGNHSPDTDTAVLRVLSRGAAPPAAASWATLAPLDAPCSAPPAAQYELLPLTLAPYFCIDVVRPGTKRRRATAPARLTAAAAMLPIWAAPLAHRFLAGDKARPPRPQPKQPQQSCSRCRGPR
jgi:hypothetical protein